MKKPSKAAEAALAADESGAVDGVVLGGVDPHFNADAHELAQMPGVTLSPEAQAAFKVKPRQPLKIPTQPVTYRSFHVWGKGHYLGCVKQAVDEGDAIAQIVAAAKITDPEAHIFRATAIAESETIVTPDQIKERLRNK